MGTLIEVRNIAQQQYHADCKTANIGRKVQGKAASTINNHFSGNHVYC